MQEKLVRPASLFTKQAGKETLSSSACLGRDQGYKWEIVQIRGEQVDCGLSNLSYGTDMKIRIELKNYRFGSAAGG